MDLGLNEGFYIGRDNIQVTHLQFADENIFLFKLWNNSEVVGINILVAKVEALANSIGFSKSHLHI